MKAFNQQRVVHYLGVPPILEHDGKDRRTVHGRAAFVAIQENADGTFLYRFDESGRIVGDTCHPTVEEAKEQALYEYGEALQDWVPVPSDVTNAIEFGLRMNRTAK